MDERRIDLRGRETRLAPGPWRLPGGGLALLGLLLVAMPVAAGTPQALRLGYYGYLGDAHVLEMRIDLALVPENRPERYRAAVELATVQALQPLFPLRFTAEAEGAAVEQAEHRSLQPERYHSLGELWQARERTILTYGPDGTVVIAFDPARPDDRPQAVPGAEREVGPTLDPLSAAVAAIVGLAETGACNGRLPVFDGVRRYDLSLSPVGPASVARARFSLYSGPATECVLRLDLREGFRAADIRAGLYPETVRAWFAPAVPGAPALPVRLAARSAIGAVQLDLVEARLVSG